MSDIRATSLIIGRHAGSWLVATLVVVVGCGGTGDDEGSAAPTAPSTSIATSTATSISTSTTTSTTTSIAAATPTTRPTEPDDAVDAEPPPYLPPTPVERADPVIFEYESSEPTYEVIDILSFRGVEMQRIKFESPLGGMAYGYLAQPAGEPVDGVGVLRAHGIPVDGTDEFIPMSILACAGVTSIVVDAPYARPGANRMGDPLFFTPDDRDEQVQLIVDMRRAVDILETLGVERFGFGGISYGAAVGGLVLGVEPRLETGVLILGNGGIVERFFNEDRTPRWPLSERTDDEIRAWVDALLPVEPIQFIGDSHAHILFMNGTKDDVVTPSSAERYHAAGPPGSEVVWMDIDHDIPFENMAIHDHWLGEDLGIDLDRLDTCRTDLFPNGWDDL